MTSRDERNEQNRAIIEEFRANGGQMGGRFADATLLLLSTAGAKTGDRRINTLAYLADGDRWLVFASKAGAPTHPDWYHNLVANPAVTVEVETEKFKATAKILEGEERDRFYAQQAERNPVFVGYEQKTTRKIPVVALSRA